MSTKTVPGVLRLSRRAAALLLLGMIGTAGAVGVVLASDHQDTPVVELNSRLDINDVYAFPGSSPDRIVLAMTTSSPITPAQTPGAGFDPDFLYQIKVDNNGDAIEDLVLQFTFEGTGSSQMVNLRGPAPPDRVGAKSEFLQILPALSGPTNTVLGDGRFLQLFAGVREDPFFLDLEQFFRIIPDRAPVQGPLSKIGPKPEATEFRDPGIDFFVGLNSLALVVELPVALLLEPGVTDPDPVLGFWGTTSR